MMKALRNWIALKKAMAKIWKRTAFWKQSFDNTLFKMLYISKFIYNC